MNRIMLSAFALAATVTLALNTAQAAKKQIVFINPGKQGEVFWELTASTMRAASQQLGFDLEILWSERNKFTMQSLGHDVTMRPEKPDILILTNEENAAAPILKAADAAGIKTFFLLQPPSTLDSASPGETPSRPKHLLGSLEPDMVDAGHRMAQSLVAAAREKNLQSPDGKIYLLALAGDQTSPTSLDRTRGFMDYVGRHSDIVVDRLLYSNWNRADAAQLSERYLGYAKSRQIRLAGVWAANDPMAIGAIDALERNHLQAGKDVIVVGLNWSGEAIDYIKQGKLLMSDGGHFFGGAWSMVILSDYFAGCNLMTAKANSEPRIMFPMSPITRSTTPVLTSVLVKGEFTRIDFKKFTAVDKGCQQYDFSFDALVRAMPDVTIAN